MSDLSDKIEEAVLNTLSEIADGPVTGFVGLVNYLDDEGNPSYCFFGTPEGRIGELLGMARAVSLFYEEQFRGFLHPDDGD